MCTLRVALTHPGAVLLALRAASRAVTRGNVCAWIEGVSAGAMLPALCAASRITRSSRTAARRGGASRHAWGAVLSRLRSVALSLHVRMSAWLVGVGLPCLLWRIGSWLTAFKLSPCAVALLEFALCPCLPVWVGDPGGAIHARALVSSIRYRMLCLKDEATALYLELVRCIARRHTSLRLRLGNLVQEGMVGLVRALDRYRRKGGCRFPTYASWWVRQHVVRATLACPWDGRIPPALYGMLCRIRLVATSLLHRHGRRPTPTLVARELGVNACEAELALRALSAYQGAGVMRGVVAELAAGLYMRRQDCAQHDATASGALPVDWCVATMTVREASILRMRLAAGARARRTLGDIGSRFGITRERVRQIEARVLKRMRQPMPAACSL
ncbi:RNA polymerase sigma factor RpoD [Candidatus Tremblaya princeps]|uniref:RNA polymerase sigma factor RpoD n=1 Tax=Tremblaya princeps TaxID=189385 RepID=A0A143WP01_TREPR|nr:RNA polymerase sigma factor RpoD [Candidatus Tremblaya princeps]